MTLEVFSDGSLLRRNGSCAGGWASITRGEKVSATTSGAEWNSTSARMELTGLVRGLGAGKNGATPGDVRIFCDCDYVFLEILRTMLHAENDPRYREAMGALVRIAEVAKRLRRTAKACLDRWDKTASIKRPQRNMDLRSELHSLLSPIVAAEKEITFIRVTNALGIGDHLHCDALSRTRARELLPDV